MAREDRVRVALEVIQAERRAVREPVAPSTRTKVIPAVKPMPRVGVKAMPRIPDPASRTFPKGAQHGYSYVSGPSPASWTRTPTRTRSSRVPAPQPAAVPAATRVLGHGRPLTAFFPHPAKALPAAMTPPTTLSAHHSRPTSPRSSQALICPRLSDQKAREHLSLPFLSGSFISFSFMRLHLICSIQSASISPHMSTRSGGDPMFRPQLCAPSLPSPEPFQLTTAIARSPCLCHSSAVQRSCTLRSPCVPASVRASQNFSYLNGCRFKLAPPHFRLSL